MNRWINGWMDGSWKCSWAHIHEVVSSSPTHVQWRCGVVILSPPPRGVRSPSNTSPPVHPAANGDLEYFWGANSLAISHTLVMVQVGLRVPTPLTRRDGQSSCEFLARLQEFASNTQPFLRPGNKRLSSWWWN